MNEVQIRNGDAFITLTKGYVAVIDSADLALVGDYQWTAFVKSNGQTYVIAKKTIRGKRVTFLLHRIIMKPPSDMTVDHIDRDPLNNRRSNMRIVTQAKNNENRSLDRGGVVFHRQRSMWQARVNNDSRRVYLGSYSTEAEARAVVSNWLETNREQIKVTPAVTPFSGNPNKSL